MAKMEGDPDLADIFKSGHDAGLRPRTVVEETYILPWWRTILPWPKPGLAFYPYDPNEHDSDASS